MAVHDRLPLSAGGALPAGSASRRRPVLAAAFSGGQRSCARCSRPTRRCRCAARSGAGAADAERVSSGLPDSEPRRRTDRSLPRDPPPRRGCLRYRVPVRAGAAGARQVAVKVMAPGSGDRQTLARFEPNGRCSRSSTIRPSRRCSTPARCDGRPFFVMEYVAGQPIGGYCAQRSWRSMPGCGCSSTCAAASEHAHRHRIVHRDSSPPTCWWSRAKAGHCRRSSIRHRQGAASAAAAPALQTDTGRASDAGLHEPEQAAGQSLTSTSAPSLRARRDALRAVDRRAARGAATPVHDSERRRTFFARGPGTQTTTNSAPPSQRRSSPPGCAATSIGSP